MAQRRGGSGARGTRAGAGKSAGGKRGAAGGRGASKRGASAKSGAARKGGTRAGAAKRGAPATRRNTRAPESYRGAVNLRGSDNYASKLREADVRRAKEAHDRGAGVRELAAKYGVNPSTMSRALRGLTFQHVPTSRSRGAKRAGGRGR